MSLSADRLDIAWAEAEAALPSEVEHPWHLALEWDWLGACWRASARPDGVFHAGHTEFDAEGEYVRTVLHKDPTVMAFGSTPAWALRDLASTLRRHVG